MSEGLLNHLEEDALIEILNIGMGRAAASLAQMIGEEIKLSIPRFALVDRQGASSLIEDVDPMPVAAVRQRFVGPFRGSALLVYPEEKSLELVRSLLQEDVALDALTELERESLLEVGNIILNACLGSIANMMDFEFTCDLPEYLNSQFNTLLSSPFDVGTAGVGEKAPDSGDNELVLFLFVDFITHGNAIKGYVVLLMDVVAISRLKRELDRFIQNFQP